MGIKTRKQESLWMVPLKAVAMGCTAIFLILSFLAAGFSLAKAQQEPQSPPEAQEQAPSLPSEAEVPPLDEIEPNEIEPQGPPEAQEQAPPPPLEILPLDDETEPNGQEPQGPPEAQEQAPPPPSAVTILPIDEIEPNEIEPQAIPNNANVRGQLSNVLDQDLYQVYIPSTSLFTITLRHDQTAIPSSISGLPVGWRVTLYGATEKGAGAYELVFGARVDKETATRSMGLSSGTYLIRVSPPFNIPITGYADLPYTLEVRTGPLGNVRDIEPNDNISTTSGKVLDPDGTSFQGWLQQANDVDYYRVNIIYAKPDANYTNTPVTLPYSLVIETGGTPQASPYLDQLESRTCTTGRVSVFSRTDTTNPISSFCLVRGKRRQSTLYLSSGLYYIRIDRPIPVGDAYSYTIQLEESSF